MRGKVLGSAVGTLAFFLVLPAHAGNLGASAEQTVQSPSGWKATAAVDFIYATRDSSENDIIIQDVLTGATVLDSNDFDFGWQPGLDARLGVASGRYEVGARFFGAFNFDDTQRTTTPLIWTIPTVPPLFGLGQADFTSHYDTSLNSFEINASRLLGDNDAIFIGVRGLALDEKLKMLAVFPGSVNTAAITYQADTVAVGPQVGAKLHYGGRSYIEADGRLGVLFTDSDLDFKVQQNIGPAFTASGRPNDWIPVAEVGITAGFSLGPSTSIRAGYRLLLIDDVPTAASTVAATQVLQQTIQNSHEDVFIHGVTVGFQTVW